MPSYFRAPPRRRAPRLQFFYVWSSMLAALVAILALIQWSERLPAVVPADASPASFSAARAWPVLSHLTDTIGDRVTGSVGAARALGYLESRLRAIPGIEVEVQDAVGVLTTVGRATAYRAQNLLVKIPGERPDAVLLSSHYDTPIGSVGAADAAVAVAVLVEVVRALSESPRLPNSIIVNINDAEEQGLLGARGFLAHPWASDVRAFVNLESAGTDGKAVLFQTGPGNHWLTRAYASAAPHPYGSVIGQDIFQSGLVPSRTDFEVYRDAGALRGLDIAFYRGGWGYHTALDVSSAIAPGSIQHMGDNTLAVARSLGSISLGRDSSAVSSVYYDVLGLAMIAYDQTTAAVIAGALALLGLVTIVMAMRRGAVSARNIATATLSALLGVLLGILLAVGGAMIAASALGRPHGWYASPGRGALAYGLLALSGLLAAQWLFARYSGVRHVSAESRTAAALSGSLVTQMMLLAALTIAGVGSAYLLAWGVGGGIVALALFDRAAGWKRGLLLAFALTPASLFTLQTTFLLVNLFAPVAGRFPLPFPFDPVLASVVAVGTIVAALGAVAVAQYGERLGLVTAIVFASGLCALAFTTATFPFTSARPQRLYVEHEYDNDTTSIRVSTPDFPGPRRAVAAAGVELGNIGVDRIGQQDVLLRAPRPAVQAAPVVVSSSEALSDGGRLTELRLPRTSATQVLITVLGQGGGGHQADWRIGGEPLPVPISRLRFVSAPDSGWAVTVRSRDATPIRIAVEATYDLVTPSAQALIDRLPSWTAPVAWTASSSVLEVP